MINNKKGFTLVEILSVIVLIGLLLGIGIPGVMRISERMKERSYNTKVGFIEQAGVLWGQDNKTRLQTSPSCNIEEDDGIKKYPCHKIAINDLISEDYLEADDETIDAEGNIVYEYINPNDNSNISSKCVYVYKKNNRVYSYYSKSNEDCDIKSNLGGNIDPVTPSEDSEDLIDETLCIENNAEVPFEKQQLLSYQIYCNAYKNITNNNENITTLKDSPETTPAEEKSEENEKTLSKTEDNYGDSYYFRGNVKDNYLTFNNMCWRIVRIQGDGSIKLILASSTGTCSEENLFEESATIYVNDSAEDKTIIINYINEKSYEINVTESEKNIIGKLNIWFENNFQNEMKNKLKEDSWYLKDVNNLYDKDGNSIEGTELDIIQNHTEDNSFNAYYDMANRIYEKKEATLNYNLKDYIYSKSYIGGLTADEVAFAGGVSGSNNNNCYLVSNSKKWYTISLATYYCKAGGNVKGYTQIYYEKQLNSSSSVSTDSPLRPAITLNENTMVASGDGTLSNPYTLK